MICFFSEGLSFPMSNCFSHASSSILIFLFSEKGRIFHFFKTLSNNLSEYGIEYFTMNIIERLIIISIQSSVFKIEGITILYVRTLSCSYCSSSWILFFTLSGILFKVPSLKTTTTKPFGRYYDTLALRHVKITVYCC